MNSSSFVSPQLPRHTRAGFVAPGAHLLVEHHGADRRAAEVFIADCYARRFGAQINAYMPRLFTLRDEAQRICAAFGVRSAHHRLFSERYLDAPIEQLISRCADRRVDRSDIVEVGHLCGVHAGASRGLIAPLASALTREGFRWVAFTGTASLRNAFRRVGLEPLDLAVARIERLAPEERAQWGRYYSHRPRVSAGEIALGVNALVGNVADAEVAA